MHRDIQGNGIPLKCRESRTFVNKPVPCVANSVAFNANRDSAEQCIRGPQHLGGRTCRLDGFAAWRPRSKRNAGSSSMAHRTRPVRAGRRLKASMLEKHSGSEIYYSGVRLTSYIGDVLHQEREPERKFKRLSMP